MQFKTNAIYCGDCLDILRHFSEKFVDLIYLDPPFSSGRIYNIVFGSKYEKKAFDDRWKGGINHYVEYMRERMELCKRVLNDNGSIYLHCDWHASHYLKVMMDDIFGYNNFRNEIVWHYGQRTMHNPNKWNAKHDMILFYAKSNKTKIKNQVTIPWTKGEISKKRARKILVDKNGREYIWDNRGVAKGYPPKKQYINDIMKKGKAVDDVWDIPMIVSTSTERLGYPTQKPENLLERIITASSNSGEIVLDPFCGCGTTIAVAHKLGRKWIGIDISPTACKVMKQRMGNVKTMGIHAIKNVSVTNLPKTEKDLWKLEPFEFENWVCDVLFATQTVKVKDMGIDGFTLDGTAIQAKHMEKAGRKFVDEFETAIKRAKRNKGIIVAFGFTKDAYEEVARIKKEGIEIILRTVKELLDMGF